MRDYLSDLEMLHTYMLSKSNKQDFSFEKPFTQQFIIIKTLQKFMKLQYWVIDSYKNGR